MNVEMLLAAVRDALQSIAEPRFYATERGYQGQLLVELSHRIPQCFSERYPIVEQEHQKTLEIHGLNIRPDIVIHEPFDPLVHANRREGNYAVFELALRAGPAKATDDFASLESMLDVLGYPLGIFVNIAHNRTHLELAPASIRGRIVASQRVSLARACISLKLASSSRLASALGRIPDGALNDRASSCFSRGALS